MRRMAATTAIPDDFSLELIDWSNAAERDAARAVRETVFVLEQHVPPEDEEDEFDPLARHVLARDRDGRAIATGRLAPNGMIGRMAVLAEWRGKAVGSALLTTLIDTARSLAYPAVELHAQTHAESFYSRFGFVAYGEPFEEGGTAHRHMRLELGPHSAPPRAAQPPRPELRTVAVESKEQALAE